MSKYKKTSWLGLLGLACAMHAAVAAPLKPDHSLGVRTNSYYAYKLKVPKGKAIQFIYGYSAGKENQVMIYNMREDKNIQTHNNGRGNRQMTNIFSAPEEVTYLLTGYSKNCWLGSKKCPRLPWVQEPIMLELENKTVRFDDSCDPSPGHSCTHDDSYISWRIIN